MNLDSLIVHFQQALGPINRLPTWANELITPLVVLPLLWLAWGRRAGPALVTFLLCSFGYERFLDPWGYSVQDMGWRTLGAMVLALVLWCIEPPRE